MAITGAASEGNLLESLFFFGAFFLGTSIFFLPIPFMGLLKRKEALQTIGKMAAGLIGVYYLGMGVLILVGGVRQL
jgi:hypothetical protein